MLIHGFIDRHMILIGVTKLVGLQPQADMRLQPERWQRFNCELGR